MRRGRGDAADQRQRAGGQAGGQEGGADHRAHCPDDAVVTKVGTTMVVVTPCGSVMLMVTSPSPRWKLTVVPPKDTVPLCCGLLPKMALEICWATPARMVLCS